MKNEHLIPVNIVDLVDRFKSARITENEKLNYVIRLEAIRDYVNEALIKNKIPNLKEVNRR